MRGQKARVLPTVCNDMAVPGTNFSPGDLRWRLSDIIGVYGLSWADFFLKEGWNLESSYHQKFRIGPTECPEVAPSL